MKQFRIHIMCRALVSGLSLFLLLCSVPSMQAQKGTYTWNPQHMLGIGAGGGITK